MPKSSSTTTSDTYTLPPPLINLPAYQSGKRIGIIPLSIPETKDDTSSNDENRQTHGRHDNLYSTLLTHAFEAGKEIFVPYTYDHEPFDYLQPRGGQTDQPYRQPKTQKIMDLLALRKEDLPYPRPTGPYASDTSDPEIAIISLLDPQTTCSRDNCLCFKGLSFRDPSHIHSETASTTEQAVAPNTDVAAVPSTQNSIQVSPPSVERNQPTSYSKPDSVPDSEETRSDVTPDADPPSAQTRNDPSTSNEPPVKKKGIDIKIKTSEIGVDLLILVRAPTAFQPTTTTNPTDSTGTPLNSPASNKEAYTLLSNYLTRYTTYIRTLTRSYPTLYAPAIFHVSSLSYSKGVSDVLGHPGCASVSEAEREDIREECGKTAVEVKFDQNVNVPKIVALGSGLEGLGMGVDYLIKRREGS